MTASTPTGRIVRLGASGLLALGAVAGCSSNSPTATESATPSDTASAAYCASADAVSSSLAALLNTKVIQEGTETLQSRFDTFQTDVGSLIDSAGVNFATQSAAVDASVTVLQTAVANVKDSPTAADVAALKPALEGVSTSTKALVEAVQGACPTS